MTISVLLVEDDIDLAATVVDYLEIEGISCDHAANGVQGLSLIDNNDYHVILLDINLPRLDGLSVCQKVRASSDDTPILMLTARDSLKDKVAGFDAGTDDYLVKPFEIEELLVRIIALSKRRSGQATSLNVGNLALQLKARTATYAGESLKLTPITFKLLEKLMREATKPVTRNKLMLAVWGEDQPDSNSLKVHIHHLRKQLDKVNANLSIDTEAGFGFVLRKKSP
ncbi:response regulator transcription factor [Colwellia psychrerythraea]|uniref:Two component transcriptional regulator, winged helix family n=1 Tax=Colwellia psychrerythraea TaxID=28229 RepID=A0A099KM72_COLPS|nr:response regulator transcription factor [Colwellia psychrerythraea]KGJ91551.1 two component transcriptional regulator, winged helix family [Colwellia psychrerythraea]